MKPVLRKGKLTTWKDDKGFGFIRSSDGTQDVFIHITALKETNHRPQVGDLICYQLTVGKDGRIHASNAFIEGVVSKPLPRVSSSAIEKETFKLKAKSSLMFEVLLLSKKYVGVARRRHRIEDTLKILPVGKRLV
ncbi:MAG: cold shock domain-containing protein [Nostoc sp.]|uniref:cold shock domain-containing protein n=1 Tax=Nostoc sp. TaxID=1180 RepID=UPI002FF666C7